MDSIDIYSNANPALCSIVLWHFIQSYSEQDDRGCELPLLYTVLPIVLSSKLEKSFNGTNKSSGFYKWLNNSPQVINQLGERIEGTKIYTKNGFLLGLATGALNLDNAARFSTSEAAFKRMPNIPASNERIKKIVNITKRLGTWMGQVSDTREIFKSLRLIRH